MEQHVEHPSGQQFELRRAGMTAVVTEVGGGLRTFTVDEVDILDGFPADAMCDGARGQSLLPWPNRVRDGRYRWHGEDQQLTLTEPDRHNAIHGLTRWANWELIDLQQASIHLRHRLHAQPGWPFLLRMDLRYALADAGLTVETTLTNIGRTLAPAAAGAHPYLSPGNGTIDGCTVVVPGSVYLPTDEQGIPTGRRDVAGTDYDLRDGRQLGAQELDVTFTHLTRDDSDRAHVALRRPDGHTVGLWSGSGYPYLEIFTGDTLAPDRRRRGLGVEPMTAPPNALATGEDLLTLEPGRAVELGWGLGLL
jgi:aldose 1-epimerase